eukprot:358671-Chlamydomonas_euryale.AAC.9
MRCRQEHPCAVAMRQERPCAVAMHQERPRAVAMRCRQERHAPGTPMPNIPPLLLPSPQACPRACALGHSAPCAMCMPAAHALLVADTRLPWHVPGLCKFRC